MCSCCSTAVDWQSIVNLSICCELHSSSCAITADRHRQIHDCPRFISKYYWLQGTVKMSSDFVYVQAACPCELRIPSPPWTVCQAAGHLAPTQLPVFGRVMVHCCMCRCSFCSVAYHIISLLVIALPLLQTAALPAVHAAPQNITLYGTARVCSCTQ